MKCDDCGWKGEEKEDDNDDEDNNDGDCYQDYDHDDHDSDDDDDDDGGDAGVEDKAIEDRRRADRWTAHGSRCRASIMQYCSAGWASMLQYWAEILKYCSAAIWSYLNTASLRY